MANRNRSTIVEGEGRGEGVSEKGIEIDIGWSFAVSKEIVPSEDWKGIENKALSMYWPAMIVAGCDKG